MLTSKNITELLSDFYRESSLQHPESMLIIAEMLETVRPQFENKKPYDVWNYLRLERNKFGNDVCIGVLTKLRQAFFELVFENQFQHVIETARANPGKAFNLLRQYYAEAIVNFREDFICLLSGKAEHFDSNIQEWISKVKKASGFLGESRWVELFPFYQEIYNDHEIEMNERVLAETISGQIILYNFPDPLLSEKYFQNATDLLPDHIIAKRGWGEFFQKKGDRKKAREIYLEVISKEPYEYLSYLFLGDCFFEETKIKKQEDENKEKETNTNLQETIPGGIETSKHNATNDINPETTALQKEVLSNEEFWYYEGWRANLLQSDSCRRLINFYGRDKESLSLNENKISGLLKEIEKLNWYPQKRRYQFTDKGFSGCFNDTVLYHAYKELASNYFAADLYEKAEELYKKATKLQPQFAGAYIDLANQKIKQKEISKAQKYFEKALQLDPDSYDVHWSRAYFFETTKNKEEAVRAYEKCRELRPDWSDWVDNFIGNVYFDFEDYHIAESFYRKAIDKNSSYKIYQDNLLLALQKDGEKKEKKGLFDEAKICYQKIAEQTDDAKDWNRLGNLYYHQKKFKESENFYMAAIKRMPKEPVYHENLGLAYEKQNLFEKAKEKFSDAIELNTNSSDGGSLNQMGLYFYSRENYDNAIDYYGKALERESNNIDYLYNIAMAYEKKEEVNKALQYYLEAEKIQNSDDLQNRIGLMYYRQNEHEKAIKYFSNASELNKLNPVYLENIASSNRLLGKTDLAEKYLEEAIKVKPDNDFAYNELGRIYFEKRDYDKAISLCKKALEFHPDNFQYYENLGFAYRDKDEPETAVSYFLKSIEINPAADLSLNELGRIYFQQEKYQEAIEICKKALNYNPGNWQFFENMGFAYERLKNIPLAIDSFEKAISLKKNNHTSLNALGLLYYKQKQYSKAIELYRKAIAIEANNVIYATNLALAYRDNGSSLDAIDSFKSALELDEKDYLNWNDLGNMYCTVNNPDLAIDAYNKAISIRPDDITLFSNKALAFIQSGKLKDAEKLINSLEPDDKIREGFIDQAKLLFHDVHIDLDANKNIMIKNADNNNLYV